MFAGKTAVVFGSTGNVGRSAVIAFLAAGAKVIAPVRDAGRVGPKVQPHVSEAAFANLVEIVADVSTDVGKADILAATDGGKLIDHVVSSFGPWWDLGPLSGIAPDSFLKVYNSNLFPHYHAWRTLAPALLGKDGATYSIVTGAAGMTPGASGITGVSAAGLFGLCDAMIVEAEGKPLKVAEVRIAMRVTEDGKEELDGTVSSKFGIIFTAVASKPEIGGVQKVGEVEWAKLTAVA